MFKIIKKTFLIIVIVLSVVSASYISATTTRPMDINTDAPSVIDESNSDPDQIKNGQISLKNFLVGFIPNQSCDSSGDDSRDYTYINDKGAMSIGRCAPGAGIMLDIKGKSGVKGTIRALKLAHTEDVNVPVCVDDTGSFILCSESVEYNTVQNGDGDSESQVYPLVIPNGVKTLHVKIYGAGGAGYGTENIKSRAGHGDDSFLKGPGVSLVAYGGSPALSPVVSGIGGSTEIDGDPNKIDIIDEANGGNGETPPSFNLDPVNIKTGICNSSTYYLMRGGVGGVGGKGGASYQGQKTNGGTGGASGPLLGDSWSFTNGDPDAGSSMLNCTLFDTTSDDHVPTPEINNRPGGDGVDGVLGGGGSGFGGKGGLSALTNDTDCDNVYPASSACFGGDAAPGGGAGGYIHATINNVKGGEVFYVKVGRGGIAENYCDGTGCEKDLLGGGASSGKGGDGKVIVEYDYNS